MTQLHLLVCLFLLAPCLFVQQQAESESSQTQPKIPAESFGKLSDGREAVLYTLSNLQGVKMRVTNYGGIIVSLEVPDSDGNRGDIVLGFDSLHGYLDKSPYFGALIGRYGNRIANGEFVLHGVKYTLAKNNGPNSLHGGVKGFDKVLWQGKPFREPHCEGIVFTYASRDGEEGYPGNLKAAVTYTTLTDKNELLLEYIATTDKATPVNLTQHTYFNLAGEGKGDVLAHRVTISADRFTPVDKTLIPTGELRAVQGTPFDFRKAKPIGEHINDKNEQLEIAAGYDHNFVLKRKGTGLSLAARVQDASTGRVMEVFTTEPGIQLYSGNFLDGTILGKHGHTYVHRGGFCLETQHFPDSPNHPGFPSTILKPGETYHSKTIYKFSVTAASSKP